VLHVVPPLIDRLLHAVKPDVLGRCLSTVQFIITGAVGITDNTVRRTLQTLPGVQLLQGK